MTIKRVEISERNIYYLYASIISIVPSKFQHQALQVMLERGTNKKYNKKDKITWSNK